MTARGFDTNRGREVEHAKKQTTRKATNSEETNDLEQSGAADQSKLVKTSTPEQSQKKIGQAEAGRESALVA